MRAIALAARLSTLERRPSPSSPSRSPPMSTALGALIPELQLAISRELGLNAWQSRPGRAS